MTDRAYQPDFALPPGETIKEKMKELGISIENISGALGLTVPNMCDLLAGKISITKQLAEELSYYFQIPKYFWLNLQAQYDETKAQIAREAKETN